jgi:hypothetical protein
VLEAELLEVGTGIGSGAGVMQPERTPTASDTARMTAERRRKLWGIARGPPLFARISRTGQFMADRL